MSQPFSMVTIFQSVETEMCYSYAALWRRTSWALLVGWPLKTLSTVAISNHAERLQLEKIFIDMKWFLYTVKSCVEMLKHPQQSFVLPYTTSASGLCVVYHLFFINWSTDAEQIPGWCKLFLFHLLWGRSFTLVSILPTLFQFPLGEVDFSCTSFSGLWGLKEPRRSDKIAV